MRHATFLLILAAGTYWGAASAAQDLPTYDFEQGAELAKYPRLHAHRTEPQIVPGGANDRGHCLKISTPAPAGECGLEIAGPIKICKNLTLAFDHKTQIEPGFEGAYLGIAFYVDGKQYLWTSSFRRMSLRA